MNASIRRIFRLGGRAVASAQGDAGVATAGARGAGSRCAALLETLERRSLFSTFNVTSLADSGAGSLRQAILDANAAAGADVVSFQAGLSGTIALTGGALSVSDSLQIIGPGASVLSVDGNGSSRVFLFTGGTCSASGLTIRGGHVGSGNGGGGILNNGATLTLDGLVVSGNSSTVTGGGIRVLSGATTITNSSITGNTANTGGGGLYISDTVTMTNSTVSGNNAGSNGGGLTTTASFTMRNSTVSGNSADSNGGGIQITATGSLTAKNSTVAGNSAGVAGGGISIGGTATAVSTIISANTVGAAASDISGVIAAGSINNLVGDAGSAGGLTNGVSGNIVGVDPLLGNLESNGGPTQTRALLAGSPAINKGSNPDGLTTDQRGAGFARTQGTVVDIGAYEAAVNPTLTSLTLSPTNVIIGQSVTLTANGAADSDGTISSVKFYRDDDFDGVADASELLGTDSSANGGYKWTDSSTSTYSPGAVRYLAVAVDNNANLSAASAATATFTVPASPMIVRVVDDVNNGNFSASDLSLREAISIANNYPGPDTITFHSSLFGLVLPLAGSPLTVTDSVTITGLGRSDLHISGEFNSPVFDFVSGVSTLSGLAVTAGAGADWGGIRNSGTLTVSDLWVWSNSGALAGGLSNQTTGDLTVVDSLISGNFSRFAGGGISNLGRLTISGSTLENNTAMADGGGLYSSGFVAMTMSDCAVVANSAAANGGGVSAGGLSTVIYNSTIASNSAAGRGGGISGGLASLYNTTIAHNSSVGAGAGIDGVNVFAESTLIAGNSRSGVPWDVNGTMHASSRNNLIQDAAHAGGLHNGVTGNLVGVDPMLGVLDNHGGPTETIDLLPGSPAIGTGINARNLSTDQRGAGYARTAGFATDIGAFEFTPRPVSNVNPLAPTTGAKTFEVSWAGTTDADELPIASYSIYVSMNGGPFTAWLTDTAATSGQFTGLWGRTYSFYSVAKDGQGFVEDQLALPDASTFVGLPGITYWDGDANDRMWENPFNWSGDAIPVAGSDVVVDDPSAPAILHSSGTTVLHTFTSNAPLSILGGSLLVTQDAQITGSVTISAGSLQLDRTASITGTLTNSGVLGLSSAASLDVNGDFVQTAGATLELGARGSKAGTFAHMNVSGTASLGGTLAMSFEATTPPLPLGGVMDVISAGSLSGSFNDAVFLDRFGRETSRFHLEYVDGRVEVVMGPVGLPHR